MLRSFNAEVDRLSQFQDRMSKARSTTPNLIPRSVHNQMKNSIKHSGQYSAHMSLQTDHGHYLHNKNYFGRAMVPDHQSWVSNSHINKRFGQKSGEKQRQPRISDSRYDDPSLYRYGQHPNSSQARHYNQFSTKFSGPNSVSESNQPLQPQDATNLNRASLAHKKSDKGVAGPQIKYSLDPRYRQSNLRRIDEDDSNENYWMETPEGKKVLVKKPKGVPRNQFLAELSDRAKINQENTGQTLEKNYIEDKNTGKRYYKRNSGTSNQPIYYIDEQGKKIIIQNTKGDAASREQGPRPRGTGGEGAHASGVDSGGKQAPKGSGISANGSFLDPVSKQTRWIYVFRTSEDKGYFIHPMTKIKILVQFSKLSKQTAYFQDPTTKKGVSIQLIRASGDRVGKTGLGHSSSQLKNNKFSTQPNQKHTQIHRSDRQYPTNTSVSYTSYTIDPKTGQKVIRRSVVTDPKRVISTSPYKKPSLNADSRVRQSSSQNKSYTLKKHYSNPPNSRANLKLDMGSTGKAQNQTLRHGDTHRKIIYAQFDGNQKRFGTSPDYSNLNTITKKKGLTMSHQHDLGKAPSQHQATHKHNVFQSSANPPKDMTFRNFDSFNKYSVTPHTTSGGNLVTANQGSGQTPAHPQNRQRNYQFSEIIKDNRFSHNSSNVPTRIQNRAISPNQRVSQRFSNISTRQNNMMQQSQSQSQSQLGQSKDIRWTNHRNVMPVDQVSNASFKIETSSKLRRNLGHQDLDDYKLKRYGKRVNE